MKNILYLLFILPTFFSCQSQKNEAKCTFFIGDIQLEKDIKNYYQDEKIQNISSSSFVWFEINQHDRTLENFEKQSKIFDFAENFYFKSKVSKIRNKDDLDLKNNP